MDILKAFAIYQGEMIIQYTPLIAIATEFLSAGATNSGVLFPNTFYGKLFSKKGLLMESYSK